jgi:RNA polymerase sigma factor (sigma-70 family)
MRRFEAMVEKCRHRIYSFAYYSLGSRDEAEDVTQEVLIRMWEHWSELKRKSLMAWVLRVTRNACLDIHRKRQTRGELMALHGEDCLGRDNPGDDPSYELERRDFRRQVERGLQELDEPYRTIVILREIEDYSYAEIREAMDMPLNTIKVYLHRGRRMLRQQLQGQELGAAAGAQSEPAPATVS